MSDINTTPLVDVMLVLLIIFLIAVPVAIQTIEKLEIPIIVSAGIEGQGREPAADGDHDRRRRAAAPVDTGLRGASRNGECRVFFNNITPVDLDGALRPGVQAARRDRPARGRPRGADAPIPSKIPQVHIRGDVNAPWRCVAGAIYNVQMAGYPTVGFISNPVDPNG